MASLRSLILALLLALLCSFHTPLAPTAKAQDLPFRSEQDDDDDDDDDDDEDGAYHTGSVCSYCEFCEHCDSCDKCPCEEGDKAEHCDDCKMCSFCHVCPVCHNLCQPGGFLDEVTGSIYKTVADVLDNDDDDN